jgi:hypothetical protein
MLHREIISVCTEKHTKHRYKLYFLSAESKHAESGGMEVTTTL